MVVSKTEHGLDILLDLDGRTMVVDPVGSHWVKFVVRRVPCSPERPHGLSYSLTLHAADGERLFGLDNAHAVAEKRGASRMTKTEYDHQHRQRTTKFYEYTDAATLLVDFWSEVDRILKQRGATS
jgi:hypothetical protein